LIHVMTHTPAATIAAKQRYEIKPQIRHLLKAAAISDRRRQNCYKASELSTPVHRLADRDAKRMMRAPGLRGKLKLIEVSPISMGHEAVVARGDSRTTMPRTPRSSAARIVASDDVRGVAALTAASCSALIRPGASRSRTA
jgi:hypothetical protein